MKKRVLSIIMAVVMIVGMIPMSAVTAFAETTSKTITANETINGGTFSGDFGNGHAVTISGSNVTEVTFNDVTFENITSTGNGGAVYVDATGKSLKLTFNRCKFINCYANYGGAVYLKDVSSNNTVTFNGCVAMNCRANNYGGFLYIEDKNTKINEGLNATDNYTVIYNCEAVYGGGVYAADMTLLKNFVFDGNKATKYGGGMYNNTADGPASVTENCLFYRNSVSDKYYGGGLYVNDSDGTVRNCRFVENIAKDTQYGGDLYTNTFIEDCTVVSNYTGDSAVYSAKGNSGYTVKAPSDCKLNKGSGTEADPYKIESTDDWDALYYAVKGGNTFDKNYIKLENDIVAVNPIGQWISNTDKTKAFQGTFDGNAHTVSLYLSNGESNNAAFNFTNGATIKNLTVKGYVKGNSGAAGIISHAENTTVENCKNYADIDGTDYAAGIVGWAKETDIKNCENYGTITATNNNAGAICGKSDTLDFARCVNYGNVTGKNNVAGICGRSTDSNYSLCENRGNITANANAGGIVGYTDDTAEILNCLSTGDIAAKQYAGGIIGYEQDAVILGNCHVFGSVSANSNAAAITGNSASGSDYKCCFYDEEKCPEDSNGLALLKEDANNYILENSIASDGFIPLNFDKKNIPHFTEEFTENTPSLWGSGKTAYYYLAKDITFENRITVRGDVHLYLLSGATLTAKKGITLEFGNTLNVYGSSDSSKAGKLIASVEGTGGNAAIGGTKGEDKTHDNGLPGSSCGTLKLYGGFVKASGEVGFGGGRGGNSGMDTWGGIGGNGGSGGELYVYGGTFIAEGTEKAIGGGRGGNGRYGVGQNGADTAIKDAAGNILAKIGESEERISKKVALLTETSFENAKYVQVYVSDHEFSYKPVYEWSGDNTTCTAKQVCTLSSCGHIGKTVTVKTSSSYTPETCTQKGYTVYTAEFEAPFETQTKKVEDKNTPKHTWTNAEQNKAGKSSLKIEATCESDAVYYKVCSVCDEISTTETWVKSGTATGHTWINAEQNKAGESSLKTEATCKSDAVYYKVCSVCGEISTTETWVKSGTTTGHTWTNEKENKADKSSLKTEATCGSDAVYYKVCSVCDEISTTETWVDLGSATGCHTWEPNGDKTHKCSTCQKVEEHTSKYKCERCGWIQLFSGISLTLGSDISINFYMELPEDARQNGTMTFNIGGRIVTVKGTDAKYNEKEKQYYFQTPLNVLEMAEIITATFTYNGKDYIEEYSVVDYIAEIVNNEEKYNSLAVALAKKIANYGYYAQIYLASIHSNVKIVESGEGYDEMINLWADDISVAAAKEALAKYTVQVTGTSDNLSLYGSTVYFDAATALNYYVTVENEAELKATAINTVTGEEKPVEIKLYKGNIYIVSVKDITATELDDDITVTINDEITLTGSVFAYCNSVMTKNGQTDAAKNAMAAFYEYHVAAVDYANAVTVSFDMMGHGNQVTAQKVKNGGKVTKPTDPDDENFVGWYKDNSCKVKWNFDTDTVSEDTTLYALWLDKRTARLKLENEADSRKLTFNNLVWLSPEDKSMYISLIDEAVSNAKQEIASAESQADVDNAVNNAISVISDYNREAHFANTDAHYEYIGNANDVVVTAFETAQSVIIGSILLTPQQKSTLLDALNDANHTADEGIRAATTKAEIDSIVYNAKFTFARITAQAEDKCFVTFNLNGHGANNFFQVVEYGDKLIKPADPTEEGFTFGGWYKDSNCTEEWNFDTDTVLDDITLYAKWTNLLPHHDTLDEYTWEELKTISNAISNGTISESEMAHFEEFAEKAETKKIKLNGEQEDYLYVRIIGFNHDELTSGDGFAGITFMAVNSINKPYYNGNNDGESSTYVPGWANSHLRTKMQEGGEIYNLLPTELTTQLQSVTKHSLEGWTSESSYSSDLKTTNDKLFLLSEPEIGFSTSSDGGTEYEYIDCIPDFYPQGWDQDCNVLFANANYAGYEYIRENAYGFRDSIALLTDDAFRNIGLLKYCDDQYTLFLRSGYCGDCRECNALNFNGSLASILINHSSCVAPCFCI